MAPKQKVIQKPKQKKAVKTLLKLLDEIETDRVEPCNTEKKAQQPNQLLYYAFTFNNYKNRDIEMMVKIFDEICYMYVFQEEGPGAILSTPTPHLQGTISLKRKMRWTEFKMCKDIHWEGPVAHVAGSYAYCSDPMKRAKGIYAKNYQYKPNLKLLRPITFYVWQIYLGNLSLTKPHDRNIYWIYGKQGSGKTMFQKWLVYMREAVILNGKPSDMKNGIVEYKKKNGGVPKLIISNIGWDKDLAKIHYSGYEDIKDMCFYSGKYEGGMICDENPHLFIFANGPPETDNEKFIVIDIDPPKWSHRPFDVVRGDLELTPRFVAVQQARADEVIQEYWRKEAEMGIPDGAVVI